MADVEIQAQHGPWRVSTRRSNSRRLRVGSQTWSMESDNHRTKHLMTLVVSVVARRFVPQHCCSATSLGGGQTSAMKLVAMSVAVETSRVCVYLLPGCCDTGNCSEVGDPPSAKPSRLEIEGREHFDVSSIGGDGGP